MDLIIGLLVIGLVGLGIFVGFFLFMAVLDWLIDNWIVFLVLALIVVGILSL